MRGDDIFEAEHLPSYARTYILPKQMVSPWLVSYKALSKGNFDESQVRKTSKKEDESNAFNLSGGLKFHSVIKR